jgi:hypothetical protein
MVEFQSEQMSVNSSGILLGMAATNARSGGFLCPVLHITKTVWWFETFYIFPYIGKNHPN